MSESFVYHPEEGLLVCVDCGFCLLPKRDLWKRHLRKQPHKIFGQRLQSLVDLFSTYTLLTPDNTRYPTSAVKPIAGLKLHDGFRCSLCPDGLTRSRKTIQDHLSKVHKRKPAEYRLNPLWAKCRLQTFFAETRYVRYFVVEDGAASDPSNLEEAAPASTPQPLTKQEAEFFHQQEEDTKQARRDATEEANKVQGFDSHPSAVVPWLRRTGIADHIRGLKMDEIRSSIALPKNAEKEPELPLVLSAMREIFEEAYGWCFDGPDCMLTWPRQVILSRFQTSMIELQGKTRGFDPHKRSDTLKAYFTLWDQFLTYLYRIVDRNHFTAEAGKRRRPEDTVRLTDSQRVAWEETLQAARTDDGARLREALERLCVQLICHKTGSRRYSSPLVSFGAMLSIRQSTSSWLAPGDFNSHLSALIWVVQLILFYHSASQERKGLHDARDLLKELCEGFLQQTCETPMGEILRWRLLLFDVSKNDVGRNQAFWNEDETILTYRDTELRVDEVPKLLYSEYEQACQLLYNELMFDARHLPRTRAWALKDSLDNDASGWWFERQRENAELLDGRGGALRKVIRDAKRLRDTFTDKDDGTDGMFWREKTIALYETTVDEFLQRLAVLVHVGAGQPLREPEFFSVMWRNGQRRRNVFVWHGRVMFHTTYHKGQQQVGGYKDNIRFLPEAVGELLLDYLVYVAPLRQSFLRQSSPKALISPYLWSKDGQVWPENKLSRCLERASARAELPRLHLSNWRQLTVSIVKTKFASDVSCFDVDQAADEDDEEMDEDVRVMTKQRNHSTRTVNRAYANQHNVSFGNVWDGLIRRNLRASSLWHEFWGLHLLPKAGKKRRRSAEEEGDSPLAKRVAAGTYRRKKPWPATALLSQARKLYGRADLEWRSPEQGDAMTTIVSRVEQVIIVLPTGAGKSLLFMLPCTLPDSGVTVLVVPLVSLRGDLLRRLGELDVDHLVWRPGEQRDASLVLVTVEAACTRDFMSYAQRLVATQRLDRIVIDESHLTVTASEYRESMVELALIRRLRTQFVYLTATLPPSMQAEFEERNYLTDPKVIRAPTNRPNIFYMVGKAAHGAGSLLQQGAAKARAAWHESGLFDARKDKIVLYVRTLAEADELAGLLGCSSYTSESGTSEEKGRILAEWVQSADKPYVVATSALGAGFDYPHVRLVIHVNEPDSLVDFAQESGRAGRDGKEAYSFVLLPAGWRPVQGGRMAEGVGTAGVSARKAVERRAMHRYLRGEECFRTCLSDHLDLPRDRRWCMEGEDVACSVCTVGHGERIGPPAASDGGREEEEEEHTGAALVRARRRKEQLELSRYREDLAIMQGTCLLCRVRGQAWDHELRRCQQRHEFFEARGRVRRRCEERGRKWMGRYQACYWCYNPQSICERAEQQQQGHKGCEHGDVVMPLCYGLLGEVGWEEWLKEEFGVRFEGMEEYLEWLGGSTRFGGGRSILGVVVAAKALERMKGWLKERED